MSTTSSRHTEAQQASIARPARKGLRRAPQLLALEQRFMFDGAAVADLAHAAGDVGVLERIAAVPAAVEVRAADPSLDQGKKEAVLVDTSVANYKTLEAGIAAGMAIIEFDGSKDGLAQIANWAASQSGYDSISILSHGADGQLHLGTTALTDSSLSGSLVRAELAELGHALKAGGDLLLYGCGIAETTDGQAFINDLSKATGADVAASSDATGSASRGGDWSLEYRTGMIEASALAATQYQGLLTSTTFDFENVTQGTISKTIAQSVGSDTLIVTSTDANLLVGAEVNAFGSDVSNASGKVLATGEGGVYIETQLSLTVDGSKSFDLTSFTLAKIGPDGLSITLTTDKGSEHFNTNFVGDSWVLNLSTAMHPSYFTGVTNVTITSSEGVFEWGFDNIVLSNIAETTPPTVSNVTASTANSSYKVGDTVSIQVAFSETVTVTGTPQLTLETGSTDRVVNYASGSGSSTLVFTYTVQAGDTSADLDYLSSSALALNGGTIKDAAGNNATLTLASPGTAGSLGANKAIVIDTTAPGAPTLGLNTASNSGATNDSITNVTSPSFSGTAEAGSTVTLYDGATSLGSISAGGGGTWSFTTSPLSSGDHTITAKATDTAGNTSVASSDLAVTIDTTAPTGLSPTSLTVAAASATSMATIATLSATDAMAITYSLTHGNGSNDADNASFVIAGTSLKVAGAALAAGTYHLYVAATDAAGNADYLAVTVTVLNAPSISSVVRASGASAAVAGSATSVAYTVSFSEAVTGVDASDFALTSTGSASGTISSVTGSGSTYTVTVNGLGGDGTLRLDLNGSGTGIQNGSSVAVTGGYTSGASYVLDHTGPSAPSAPNLMSSSDSGGSDSDNLTYHTTPTVSGTAEAGSTVTLYDSDGSTVLGTATATGGTWSITTVSLSEGNHTLTAKATDTAGNTSAASSGLTVTIDTTAPTGLSPSSVAVASASATASTTIASLSATDNQAITYSLAPGDGSNDADNGSFAIAGTSLKVGGASLSSGTYHIYVAAADAAGNLSYRAITITVEDGPTVSSVTVPANAAYRAGQSLDFTVNFSDAIFVDTTGGTPRIALTVGGSTVYADYFSGSGTSALVFRYTVQSGMSDSDGISLGALTANGGSLQNGGVANAILTLNSVASTSGVLVDTTVPTNTIATAAFSSDTGDSGSDFITQTASQTLSGTLSSALAAGEGVKVSLDGGSSWLTATTTVGQNTWSLAGQTLSGSNTLQVKVVDTAGNDGMVYSHSYAIDNTPPTAPTADSQTSYSLTPTLSGNASLASGETLSVTVGGATYNVTPSGGRWTLDLASATPSSGTLSLSMGQSYSVTASILDAAGNSSTDGSSNELSLVNLPPPSTTVSSVSLSADTGSSSSDFITNAATQTLSGSLSSALAEGEWVEVSLDGGSSWTTASSSTGSSGWSAAATLAAGGRIDVRVANSSGSGAAYAQSYTLDTTAPAAPAVASISTDSTAPVISGSAILGNGDSMTVSVGGATYAVTPSAGRWQLDLASATPLSGSLSLSQGQRYEVLATITDAAGNASRDTTTAELNIVLPLPPRTLVSSAVFSADTGSSDHDLVTQVAAQTVSGTLSAALANGERVEVSFDGGKSWQVANAAVGTKSWSIGTALAGSQVLQARVSNSGGSGEAYAHSYTLDTTAPSVSLGSLAFSSDTGSSTDFVTKDAAQTLSATLSAALSSTDKLWGSLDNGAHWVDLTGKVVGTRLSWDGIVLTGSGTLLLKVQDAAGNEGAVQAQAYVLDTAAPAVSLSNLALVGGSLKDGVIVTTTSAQTLSASLSAALASGDTVYGSLDNGVSWTHITSKVSGTTLSWSGVTIGASGTLLIKVQDAAGNSSTVATQSYKLEAVVTNSSTDTTPTVLTPAVSASQVGGSTSVALGGDSLPQVSTLSVSSTIAPAVLNATALTSSVGVAADPIATMTSSSGFQVALASRSLGGGDALLVNKPLSDVSVNLGSRVSYNIPGDAFAHTRADTTVTLTATRGDGAALPGWLSFDPRTGTFEGVPPPGFRGEVVVKVTARDRDGRQVVQTFKIVVGTAANSGKTGQIPPELDAAHRVAVLGRSGLGDQLLSTRSANADRVSTLAASAKAASLRRA